MKCHKGYKSECGSNLFAVNYWLDTGWGCGYIKVEGNIVKDTAPIFRKFIGQNIRNLKRYKMEKLK